MKRLDDGQQPLESVWVATTSDETLMLAIAKNDGAAFRLLMQRHTKSMVSLARRITLNVSDADEVVQEAFLRLWKQAPKWDVNGPARIRTWLQRVVTNLAIDRCRRQKLLPLEAAGDPQDEAQDTEASLGNKEEAEQVRAAMNALPPRQRAAIALCYFEELTDAQAADNLGVSVGALESLLVRARRHLRESLSKTAGRGK